MADRILIFSSDPGRISAELPVALPRPRVAGQRRRSARSWTRSIPC